MPVHLAGCHWGLMVIDVASQEFYFDDGMRFNPPPIDLAVAVMKSLEQNSLTEDRPQTISWPQRHVYRRFRMPQQPSDGSLQGNGSCGVGVILAARDFIQQVTKSSLPRIWWDFKQSRLHRKRLLLQVLKWSSLN